MVLIPAQEGAAFLRRSSLARSQKLVFQEESQTAKFRLELSQEGSQPELQEPEVG